jgi:hypothetical protein
LPSIGVSARAANGTESGKVGTRAVRPGPHRDCLDEIRPRVAWICIERIETGPLIYGEVGAQWYCIIFAAQTVGQRSSLSTIIVKLPAIAAGADRYHCCYAVPVARLPQLDVLRRGTDNS